MCFHFDQGLEIERKACREKACILALLYCDQVSWGMPTFVAR